MNSLQICDGATVWVPLQEIHWINTQDAEKKEEHGRTYVKAIVLETPDKKGYVTLKLTTTSTQVRVHHSSLV